MDHLYISALAQVKGLGFRVWGHFRKERNPNISTVSVVVQFFGLPYIGSELQHLVIRREGTTREAIGGCRSLNNYQFYALGYLVIILVPWYPEAPPIVPSWN